MGALVPPTWHKCGNCRCKIVDSRVFHNWSLIHGLRWSGLVKAESDLINGDCLDRRQQSHILLRFKKGKTNILTKPMGSSQMCPNVMDCVDDLSTRITRQTVPIHTMVLGITVILCSLRTSILLITKYKTDDRNVEIQEKESLFFHQTREYVGHIWTLCILKFLKSYANAWVFLTCYPTVMKVCRCLT